MFEQLSIDGLINRERDNDSSLVILMCGIAGSGKTTFSQNLEKDGFVRLSIDEEVWSANGRYGIDYPAEKYREYLDEAHIRLRNKLVKLIQDKKQVVVDSSFWQRAERDEFKRLIENCGGKWGLIYLKVHPDELRNRLKIRSQRFDANAAFTITEEILTTFLNGFEEPRNEGEIVIEKTYNTAVEAFLEVIGGKWKPVILFHLTFGKKRNGELMRLMPAVAQKVLTQQLGELVEDGIVARISYNQVPPKVEYELTEYGWSLKDILHFMCKWGDTHIERVYGDRARIHFKPPNSDT